MQRPERSAFARHSLHLLGVAWGILLVALILSSTLTSARPATVWLLPFGCLAVAFGLHFLYFRHEDAAYMRKQREWANPEYYTPGTVVLFGIGLLLLGVVFIVGAIRFIVAG